jgi:ribosomal protein S18 acetylase RimI-like enzyme
VTFRYATFGDCPLLGELNHQLIQDEGHRNRMSVAELQGRMEQWLAGEYRGVIFEDKGELVGYALFRAEGELIYLRQLFVMRHLRRRGYGREAMRILREEIWPEDKRLTVDVLVANTAAVEFWRAVGYRDYALTLEMMPNGRCPSGPRA